MAEARRTVPMAETAWNPRRPWRRALSRAVCVAACAALAGCSFTDLTGLTAGGLSLDDDASDLTGRDGGPSDAGGSLDRPDGGDGDGDSGVEAGVDGGTDSGVDSGVDAGADASADAGSVCTVTSYRNGGVAVNVFQAGNNSTWDNPSAALALDSAFTEAAVGGVSASQILRVTDFGFSFPEGARIVGLELQITRYGVGSGITATYDDAVRLRLDDSTSSGQARSLDDPWPTTATTATYGSADDTWGEPLSPSQIASPQFGVDFSFRGKTEGQGAVGDVDAIRMRVHYCH